MMAEKRYREGKASRWTIDERVIYDLPHVGGGIGSLESCDACEVGQVREAFIPDAA
jgi:hypothetical protein